MKVVNIPNYIKINMNLVKKNYENLVNKNHNLVKRIDLLVNYLRSIGLTDDQINDIMRLENEVKK